MTLSCCGRALDDHTTVRRDQLRAAKGGLATTSVSAHYVRVCPSGKSGRGLYDGVDRGGLDCPKCGKLLGIKEHFGYPETEWICRED